MKIGIRAILQAILEADDHLRGTVPHGASLGATLLTLVRRYKATQAAATDLRAGLQRLKEELNTAHRAETAAHAATFGARNACENLRAQITVLRDERDAANTAHKAAAERWAQLRDELDEQGALARQAYSDTLCERDAALEDVERLTLELGQACAAGETLQRSLDLARMDRDTQAERANDLAEVSGSTLHHITRDGHGNATCMRCGMHINDIASGGFCV